MILFVIDIIRHSRNPSSIPLIKIKPNYLIWLRRKETLSIELQIVQWIVYKLLKLNLPYVTLLQKHAVNQHKMFRTRVFIALQLPISIQRFYQPHSKNTPL